ncbi:MAG: hypothetical protein QOJ03_1618 [Frankiaceae bacterium]|jgi:hypothetical protein|nr:hypothetical protein [Frankiaceae bacterium]
MPAAAFDAAAAGVVATALAGAVALAATGSAWGTAAALAVTAVAEVSTLRRAPLLLSALEHVHGGPVLRGIGLLSVVLLAARTMTDRAVVIGTAITAVVVLGLGVVQRALSAGVRHLRRPPLLSRNLDLGDVAVPRSPAAVLLQPGGLDVAAPVVMAVGLAVAHQHDGRAAAALATAAALAAVAPVVSAAHLTNLRRRRIREQVTEGVTDALRRLAPRVVLYFASTPEETYQPDMWLEPVERLGIPAVVLLRDPAVLERLAPTSLPVVCTPYNGTVAKLPLPDSVAALFVTHSGNNLALLRRREARSVFVGHGDSDKPDSVNPFARVYEQVWVAGPLGRRRYAEARVGVTPEAIVEVGRPQVQPIAGAPDLPTVLYAPTWEGWGDDPHHSSLAQVGPALVGALLAHPGLRVVYRPHPLTGRRDPQMRRAHAEVIRLLQAAGAVGGSRTSPDARLPRDLLDESISTGRRPYDREQAQDARQEKDRSFWVAAAPATHRIVAGPNGPSLMSCFEQTTALVGDVSSVVSDFLALDRPYAVVDTRGLEPAAFCRAFPAAAGGLVIDPQLAAVATLVELASGGDDPTASARRQLLDDALGGPASSSERFADAIDRLIGTR